MTEGSAMTFIGMDVSKNTIAIALLRQDEHVPLEHTIANTPEAVRTQVRRWGDPARLRVCYEAGPTGYELERQLRSLGVDCAVIAPALIPKRPGQRVKTLLLASLVDHHLAVIDARLAQRASLDREISTIAQSRPYAAAVRRLSALRGIKELSALTLLVEVGDFARFASAREFMGFT